MGVTSPVQYALRVTERKRLLFCQKRRGNKCEGGKGVNKEF